MKNYLIVANGNFLIKEIIAEAAANKIMVALDGAYDKLIALGFEPAIVLGDFDSISFDNEWPPQTEVIHTPNQLFTDLTKGINYCDQQGAENISIICGQGGRLDHQEGVLRTLRAAYRKERPLVLHTEQQSARFAKDETITIHGEIGDKCGVIAFPSGAFSSTGLEYDVDNFSLVFGFSENTCNALAMPTAAIKIQGEALVIMPPLLNAQRALMQKNDVERLELQLRDAKCIYSYKQSR